jgi:hypothetical protein
MAMGASDYIIKPMTWDDYLAAILGAVERWMPRERRECGVLL